jgi:Ca2+-transporting ATPase
MTAPGRGLPTSDARARLKRHGPNTLPAPRGSGWLAQAWRQLVTEPMFLLLLAAAALYLLLGSRAEGALLGGFALITVLLVLVQNQRSRRALNALRALAAPQARVLRDGQAQRVPAAEVVPGDWLLLEEGERVAADATLREASTLALDESLLTGESVPVDKAPGDAVAGGTLVIGGHGLAEVTATGVASQAGRIGAMLDRIDDTPTRLQRETARLVRVLGTAAVAVSALLVVLMMARGYDALQALLAAIALSMSMLPEEFALAMTVFFVIGAWRLAQQRVLTRRSAVIETLGAATLLAVDKTGTLTENRMRLRRVVSAGSDWLANGADAAPPAVHALLRCALHATRAHTPDPLDRALRAWPGLVIAPGAKCLREHPLAPDRPFYAAVWLDAGSDAAPHAACKGAAEAVLALCALPDGERAAWAQRAGDLSSQGLRVLGVACARAFPGERGRDLPEQAQDWRFEWMGLVAFEDPLRASVPAAVRTAREAGVAVAMITGDAPGTALSIARQAGIDVSAGALLGRELDAMDDAALARAVRRVRVFARVNPTHKLRLVRALQANGELVAMTGDGVNDAPALRASDVGIGMGARGTDVAREAAALVLLDDDFSHLVDAVSQGRRIFDNLRKVMLYIVAIHVPIAGLALLPLLLGLPPLLLPAHVALIEILIDPMCTLGYESLPAERGHMRQRPRARGEALIGRAQFALGIAQGALLLVLCMAVYGLALAQSLPDGQARFLAFSTLTAGNLALAVVDASQRPLSQGLAVARPFALIAVAALAALALCVAIPGLRSLFGFEWPGAGASAAALLAGLIAGAVWDMGKRYAPLRRVLGATV